jgi:hypothetical protein
VPELRMMIREVEEIIAGKISADMWNESIVFNLEIH